MSCGPHNLSGVPVTGAPVLDCEPAFVIGVTGHMDIPAEDHEAVRARLRRMFEWVRAPETQEFQDLGLFPRRARRRWLWRSELVDKPLRGLGVEHAPIVVLSSLAAGADTLIVQVALEPDIARLGVSVRAPLPFPPALYRESTSMKPAGASDKQVDDNRAEFARLEREIGSGMFAVPLKDDPTDAAALHARLHADLDGPDPAGRRRRYRAAGEYVAARCDLLIALWTGFAKDDSGAGTDAIVKLRRGEVVSPPTTSGGHFDWADAGPVLVMPVRTSRVQEPKGDEKGLLYPYVSDDHEPRVKLIKPDAERSEHADRDFRRRIGRLEALHRDADAMRATKGYAASAARELDRMIELDVAMPRRQRLSVLKEPLRELAGWRRCFGDVSSGLDRRRMRLMVWLCALVVLGGTLLHLYAHWHPQPPVPAAHAGTAAPNQQVKGSDDRAPEDTDAHSEADAHAGAGAEQQDGAGVQLAFGLGALVAALAALGAYLRHLWTDVEPRRYDYRALAEGLRVQIYWNFAGLDAPVSENYLDRQRSELDWIRRAIGSMTFPFERWKAAFAAMPLDLRIEALEVIATGWIAHQRGFYGGKVDKTRKLRHGLHALGRAGALAGVLHLPLLLAWERGVLDFMGEGALLAVRVSTAFLGVYLLIRLVRWLRGGASEHDHQPKQNRHKKQSLWAGVKSAGGRVLEALTHRDWGELPLLFVAVTVPLPLWLPRAAPWMPDTRNLWIVLLGVLLLAGATVIAWIEKRLYAEHERQYSTMKETFTAAELRLAALLTEAKAKLNVGTQGEPEAEALVKRAQGVLRAVGREALDEHAEWLILHRARPLELFMAG